MQRKRNIPETKTFEPSRHDLTSSVNKNRDEDSAESEDSPSDSNYVPTNSESDSDSDVEAENWCPSNENKAETNYKQKPVTSEITNISGN